MPVASRRTSPASVAFVAGVVLGAPRMTGPFQVWAPPLVTLVLRRIADPNTVRLAVPMTRAPPAEATSCSTTAFSEPYEMSLAYVRARTVLTGLSSGISCESAVLVKKTVLLLAITVPVPCSLNESDWNWMLSLAELTRAELRNRPDEET